LAYAVIAEQAWMTERRRKDEHDARLTKRISIATHLSLQDHGFHPHLRFWH
jgi:hypothetical protein